MEILLLSIKKLINGLLIEEVQPGNLEFTKVEK